MSAPTITRVLTGREQFIHGLRLLADLLECDHELTTPSDVNVMAFPRCESVDDLGGILRLFDLAEARGIEVTRYTSGTRECFEASFPTAPSVSYVLYANRPSSERADRRRVVVTREDVLGPYAAAVLLESAGAGRDGE